MGRAEERAQRRRDRQVMVASVPYKDREMFSKIQNNRITADDLERVEKLGYERGYRTAGVVAAENTMRNCYAAAALAMQECYPGISQDDVCRFLTCMDEKAACEVDDGNPGNDVQPVAGRNLCCMADRLSERNGKGMKRHEWYETTDFSGRTEIKWQQGADIWFWWIAD